MLVWHKKTRIVETVAYLYTRLTIHLRFKLVTEIHSLMTPLSKLNAILCIT